MQLGKILKNPVIHLDDIFHGPFWKEPSREIFQVRVFKLLEQPIWIMDGNYSAVREFILSKATLAIILDLPVYVLFWRLFIRTLGRNTRFKVGSITPLPQQVYKSGAKEHLPSSLFELWKYALKFRREKFFAIKTETMKNLRKSNVIILRTKQSIAYFLSKVQSYIENYN
ncbi:MAG: hypothetical protein ACFFBD_27370 [Candidatus Hodarchaeota archaeon]